VLSLMVSSRFALLQRGTNLSSVVSSSTVGNLVVASERRGASRRRTATSTGSGRFFGTLFPRNERSRTSWTAYPTTTLHDHRARGCTAAVGSSQRRSYTSYEELPEEVQMIREGARKFAEEEVFPVAARNDAEHLYPAANIRSMGDLGFLGINVPEEYGGTGTAKKNQNMIEGSKSSIGGREKDIYMMSVSITMMEKITILYQEQAFYRTRWPWKKFPAVVLPAV
jgi:hypothetical protein